MKVKPIIIILAVASVLFGCTKENSPTSDGKLVERELVAVFDEYTKTSVDAKGTLNWSAGDIIRYYTASGGTVNNFTVPEDCHSTSIKITAGSKDTFVIAACGGQISEHQGESMTLTGAVSDVQNGKFKAGHVSVCKKYFENGDTLNFKNITSLIKFSLARTDVSYVTFTTGDGTKIHGNGKLYFTFDGELIPSVKFGDGEGGDSIRVNTGGSGTFYISTLPCSFTGFTICYFDDSNEILGNTVCTDGVTLPTGSITDFGEMDSRIKKPEPEKVTLNKKEISVKKDYTDTLTYEVMPLHAKVTSAEWSVKDDEIASCSQDGVVVGLTPGETWVYVEINGSVRDSCKVTCLDRVYGGKVVTESIFSDTLNATVKYNVYLPDSYERSNKQYPIVYLLHGLGGDYTNWANSGNVAKTSDDLMGSGEADEMVIIMPNAGGGDYHNVQHGYFNVKNWHYENFFFKEFIPAMETKYRAIGDKGHRAIMGLSMGGGGSVVYCQHHPEMFSSCYAMSGWFYLRPYEEEALEEMTRDKFYLTCESVMVNSTIKFLDNADKQTIKDLKTVMWAIDCGDNDYIAEESKATYDKMTEVGIESEYTVRSGAHTWEYWRQSLRLALPFATKSFYDSK